MTDRDNPSRSFSNYERPREWDKAFTSPWHNIVKTVRGMDEERINDAKEDIDNLLVFAGLFSAILTAFLIESYHALQPDTAPDMVFLLQLIATQNYTVSSEFRNTTSPIPVRQPFEAPTWALRVNGFWFASLICSLSAASLGILVKAWLRQYLSSNWISPQEKLRSRQYRHSALSQWKVFEIAAVLPLLLQIALALFFLGLSYFTASVDRRMALTTIPLICAWAFFLAMTTIAPILNPRCPFKVPGLKRTLRSGRQYVLPQLIWLLGLCSPKRSATLTTLPEEEEEAVLGKHDDTELLLDMDRLIGEDSLLPMLWAAFRQETFNPNRSIQFILRLMRHRLATLPEIDLSSSAQLAYFVDLSGLSQQAYNAFTTILADLLTTAPLPYSVNSPDWVHDAVLLLLSKTIYSYPADTHLTLRAFFDNSKPGVTWQMGDALGSRIRPALDRGEKFMPMSRHLHSIFAITRTNAPIIPIIFPLRFYNKILAAIGGVPNGPTRGSLLGTLRSTPELKTNRKVQAILEDLWFCVYELLSGVSRHWTPSGVLETLFVVMHLGCWLDHTYEAAKILRIFWSIMRLPHRHLTASTFASTSLMCPPDGEASLDMWPIIEQAWEVDTHTCTLMIQSSTELANNYATGVHTVEENWDPLDLVAFTHVHLRIYEKFGGTEPAEWEKLWNQTHLALCKYWDTQGWSVEPIKRPWRVDGQHNGSTVLQRDRELAVECMRIIESVRTQANTISGTAQVVVLPDKLVDGLWPFVPSEHSDEFSRLRWLLPLVD